VPSSLLVLLAGSLSNIPTTWSIVQTGDYDGDGMSDLLWRDTSGPRPLHDLPTIALPGGLQGQMTTALQAGSKAVQTAIGSTDRREDQECDGGSLSRGSAARRLGRSRR
jgi:hypothetical protein